jgi:hypothetical protein
MSTKKHEVINYSRDKKIKFHWNPLTQQPNIPYSKWERNLEYLKFIKDHLKMLWYSIKLTPALIPEYFSLKKEGIKKNIERGFCIGVDNETSRFERVLKEIKEMGVNSVLLRIPIWDLENLNYCKDFLCELKNSGIEPVVSILQDYNSTIDLHYWKSGIEKIISKLSEVVFYFGIGHAWNRYKWGVRSFLQYLDLVEKAEEVRKNFPEVKFFGPSVIDFEYICTMGVLNHPKRKPNFDVVNALLYVDRQGAPENRHVGFNLYHKTLLMRAIVNCAYGKEIPFWITETNWPLIANTEYIPTSLKESVDEETYADYLVRYYILSLSSGAERVYWWQLVSHGYGIIDDIDGGWRRRSAFYSFKTMSELLGSFLLISKKIEKSIYSFTFENSKGDLITVAWSSKGEKRIKIDFDVKELISRDGKGLPISDSLSLNSSPLYMIHKRG